MKNIPLADVMRKGEEFESEDKYAEAYECYKYVHGKDKTDEEALSKLALCAQCLEKKDEAINYWNSLINIDPTNHLPYTQLMDIYFHDDKYMYYMVRARLKTLDGQFSQVADDYKKAMSNTDDTQKIASARFLLAQMHEVNNKPMQAIDEYLRILDQDKNEAAYAALAAIYYNTDKSSAVHTLEQAIKHFPDNVLFKELLSKVYMETGDFEGAMKYAEDPMTQAKTLLLQEKNEEAFKILDKLPSKEKNQPRYNALMAEYYYNTNNDEKAIEFIEKYESQDPNSPLAYQMKALVYENKNDDYGSHFNWGKYNIKKGNTDVALNEYLNAYAADKSQVEVIKEIINVYTALEDNIAAIEFCEKLVEIEKDDIATLKKLVAFYDDQGYKERVIYYLEMLDELNPRDYDTLLRLAKYYESSRQMGEALEYYERYLKNAPSSEEREKIEKKVNQMQTGEGAEEEGFLDKLMGLFSKK